MSAILETVVDRFVEDLSQRLIWGMAVSVFTAELPPGSIDNSVGPNAVLSTKEGNARRPKWGLFETSPAAPGMSCLYCFERFSRVFNASARSFCAVSQSSGC
jgi:hypothetical protein